MDSYKEWLAEMIDSYHERATKGKIGIEMILSAAKRDALKEALRQYKAPKAPECNHNWIKVAPLREDGQEYMCLNCHKVKQ